MASFTTLILVAVVYTVAGINTLILGGEERLHSDENLPSAAVNDEFLCGFNWTNANHLRDKILDRMNQRHKRFIRFTVPVLNYNNPQISMNNYTGLLTWVWVMESHKYMLYYPHNFIYTSFYSLSIVVLDFALDYNDKFPVSLEGFGADLGLFNEHITAGYCNRECIDKNNSCGIGEYSLKELLLNITQKYNWNRICLQIPYDIADIEILPQYAVPDLLYYWRFLRMFYTRRPTWGWSKDRKDFIHYHCYGKGKEHKDKELLRKFWVIPLAAFIMWLYSPLLIHYFPSSTGKQKKDNKMFPAYKTPIFFGRFIRWMLCFYTSNNPNYHTFILIYIRRILFFALMVATSFRLLQTSHPYMFHVWFLVLMLAVASFIPHYFSVYLRVKMPSSFLLWELPQGVIRGGDQLIQYQLLAHVMNERICLILDCRFWSLLFENIVLPKSIQTFSQSNLGERILMIVSTITLGLPLLVFVLIVYILFWFIPLPYFYWQLFSALWNGEKHLARSCATHTYWLTVVIFHSIIMVCLLVYISVVTYVWCLAVAEITIFTMIGGAVSPTMAFQYFVLTGSVIGTVYGMIRNMHEGYDQILATIIDVLKQKETLQMFQEALLLQHNGRVVVENRCDANNQSTHMIEMKANGRNSHTLIRYNTIGTDVNTDLFFAIVERCRPIRRQVFFIFIKITAMVFYGLVAIWVKNVFHLEEKVGNIVSLISTVAVYFVPGFLQYVAYQNNYGKKMNALLKRDVYKALLEYLGNDIFA